jgi:hypothetical protein
MHLVGMITLLILLSLGPGHPILGARISQGLNELYISNDFFVEYFLSGTRQRNVAVMAPSDGDRAFAECPLSRVPARLALDKEGSSGPLC